MATALVVTSMGNVTVTNGMLVNVRKNPLANQKNFLNCLLIK